MLTVITLWLRAWVLACLGELFHLHIAGKAVSLIPECLDIYAFCSLSEGISSLIIRFIEWIYTPLFFIAVGYFDTS